MRRQRGIRESLGSIVLGFELIVLFLGALVAWGLHSGPPVLVISGGVVLVLLCAIGILTMRFRIGATIGFAVQILAVISGIWVHMMFVVGLIFLAIWIYAMYQAGKIEKQTAAQQSRNGTENQ